MDALTERTIRRLYERLEALRLKGPIPALMAESRVGIPTGDSPPLHGFEDALWGGALRQLPDGSEFSRKVWLSAAPTAAAEFRAICADAGRVAVPVLHAAEFRVGIGSADPTNRWIWAVFELAEMQIPGTILRLDGGDTYRASHPAFQIGERIVAEMQRELEEAPAFLFPARYWKLADVVEASLATLDIVQTRQGTMPANRQTAAFIGGTATATTKPDKTGRRPRGEPPADLLRRLWATAEGRQKILDAGSAARIAALIGVAKTSVIDAGAIWKHEIAPALKARRSMASYYRGESRRRDEEGLNG
jgi:hypothetical protein